VVKLLLDKGADLNSKNNDGHTALIAAAKYGRDSVVKLLLGKGANITSKDARGLLVVAAEQGREYLVKLLLDAGADVNSVHNVWTALRIAALAGQ